jgi:hypothetical protein
MRFGGGLSDGIVVLTSAAVVASNITTIDALDAKPYSAVDADLRTRACSTTEHPSAPTMEQRWPYPSSALIHSLNLCPK